MKLPSDLDGQGQRYVRSNLTGITNGKVLVLATAADMFLKVFPLLKKSLAYADDRLHQIFPSGRSSRSVGPGIEIQENPSERIWRERELDDLTSLE